MKTCKHPLYTTIQNLIFPMYQLLTALLAKRVSTEITKTDNGINYMMKTELSINLS